MTVLPELRHRLVEAAAPPTPLAAESVIAKRQRRLPALRAAIAIVAALTITGTALAASGVWAPQLGAGGENDPQPSETPVPADQLDLFAVLRRPADDADHAPQVLRALAYLNRRFLDGIRTSEVRLLADRYILIPAQRASLGVPDSGTYKTNALCLFAIDPKQTGGLSCWTTAEILAGKATLMSSEPARMTLAQRRKLEVAAHSAHGKSFTVPGLHAEGHDSPVHLVGIVPDGVRIVELHTATSTSTATVHNNFYQANLDSSVAPSIRWLGDGVNAN